MLGSPELNPSLRHQSSHVAINFLYKLYYRLDDNLCIMLNCIQKCVDIRQDVSIANHLINIVSKKDDNLHVVSMMLIYCTNTKTCAGGVAGISSYFIKKNVLYLFLLL